MSIDGGEGAPPPPKGEAGKALAKGGKRRKRGRERPKQQGKMKKIRRASEVSTGK